MKLALVIVLLLSSYALFYIIPGGLIGRLVCAKITREEGLKLEKAEATLMTTCIHETTDASLAEVLVKYLDYVYIRKFT